MTHQERDRLSIAVGFSVIVHLVIAVLSGFFASAPAPDHLPPLRVELNVPEPAPLPEPEPPAPEPAPEPTPVPEPETPAPTPQAPAPGTSAPGAAGSQGPPAGPDPLSGPAPDEITEADIWGRRERTAPRRQQPREDVLRADPDSLAPDVTRPDWAGTVLSQAGVSDDQMTDSERTAVAERIESNPEFEPLLTEAIEALDRPGAAERLAPGTSGQEPSPAPGSGTGTDGTADGSQGDPRLSWEGGDRGDAGPLPVLTAEDFEGRVPAETRFVVIFEVNEGGGVLPGSIIFQQRSVYTAVNEKLRRAIASWRFDPASGAGTQSAVFALVVRREDVR
jgi:hypothetical protein